MSTDAFSIEDLKIKLVPWFKEKMPGAEDLTIAEMEKPAMGISSETLLLNLKYLKSGQEKSTGMVLRAAPVEFKVFPEYEISHQYFIMKALKQTNVPVPEMVWMEEDESIIGTPFYIMDRLDGTMPQDYPSYHGSGIFYDSSPELRAKMWWGALEQTVNVHKLNWKKLNLSFLGEPKNSMDALDRQIAYWERYFEWIKDTPEESHPILKSAIKWIKENRYEPERITLCWGDARMGNTFYDKTSFDVIAVIDWEMAFIGDPENDLAWNFLLDWQQSAGAGLQRCEGTPTHEETVERYEALTGWKVKNLFFNEVFAAVRFGIVLVAVFKKFMKQGIPIDEEMLLNNVCTQRLSELLDLPPPGETKNVAADINEVTVTVQFHFTGPEGYDWYLLSDKGRGSRCEGTVKNPNCTIEVSLEDWKDIQTGELDQLEAWKEGRLVTSGDMGLMMQLEDMISEFAKLN